MKLSLSKVLCVAAAAATIGACSSERTGFDDPVEPSPPQLNTESGVSDGPEDHA
jgi:hypothetical protein